METSVVIGIPPTATDWRCANPGCGTLLGKKYNHGLVVLKYKDFLAEVSGNYDVTASCRRCGLRNTLRSISTGILGLVKDHG